MERLALDLAEGVLPELVLGSDEYGQNLFPVAGTECYLVTVCYIARVGQSHIYPLLPQLRTPYVIISGYTWEKEGAVEVLVEVYDDKRQFTGNVVHNALGNVCFWHGIYQGT